MLKFGNKKAHIFFSFVIGDDYLEVNSMFKWATTNSEAFPGININSYVYCVVTSWAYDTVIWMSWFLMTDPTVDLYSVLQHYGETAPGCVQKHAIHWGLQQAGFWSLCGNWVFNIFVIQIYFSFFFRVKINLINNSRNI